MNRKDRVVKKVNLFKYVSRNGIRHTIEVLYKYKSGQSTKVTVHRSGKEVTVDIKF